MNIKSVSIFFTGVLVGIIVTGSADRKTKLGKAIKAGFEAYTEED